MRLRDRRRNCADLPCIFGDEPVRTAVPAREAQPHARSNWTVQRQMQGRSGLMQRHPGTGHPPQPWRALTPRYAPGPPPSEREAEASRSTTVAAVTHPAPATVTRAGCAGQGLPLVCDLGLIPLAGELPHLPLPLLEPLRALPLLIQHLPLGCLAALAVLGCGVGVGERLEQRFGRVPSARAAAGGPGS